MWVMVMRIGAIFTRLFYIYNCKEGPGSESVIKRRPSSGMAHTTEKGNTEEGGSIRKVSQNEQASQLYP